MWPWLAIADWIKLGLELLMGQAFLVLLEESGIIAALFGECSLDKQITALLWRE